jgi:hypothetical protein
MTLWRGGGVTMHINKWKPTLFSQVSTLFARLLTYKSLLPLCWLLDLILAHILQSLDHIAHSLHHLVIAGWTGCHPPLLSSYQWMGVQKALRLMTEWSYFLHNAPAQWEAGLDCTIHTIRLLGEIDMPHQYSTSLMTWSPTPYGVICLHFTFCCVRASRWWGVTIFAQPHVATYVHVLSLCHLYPLPSTWQITNENFQKILSLCNSSHNFTPTRNEIRYHCCLSQLYFIGH